MAANANSTADDFEVIGNPMANTCGDPYYQLSHVSKDVERQSDRAIEPLVAIMQSRARELEVKSPIFHVPIERELIFDTFSGALSLQFRRVMNCHACKQFMRQYGDLCVVDDDGSVIPLAWPVDIESVPEYYRNSVEHVLILFEGKTVSNEFTVQKEKGRILGAPATNGWNHISIKLEQVSLARKNASMESQDTMTSYTMLDRILHDNNPEVIERVYHLIHDNQLPYAQSHKAPLAYLKTTSEKIQGVKDTVRRKNLATRYAREAFPGCLSSLRGGLLGFLFECVNEGQSFEELKRNWETKADPLSYMRPTAAPSVGNIESAEKIFAKLGYTPQDLERVFLTLDQVPDSAVMWTPSNLPNVAGEPKHESTDKTPAPQKLFNSLIPKNKKPDSSSEYTNAPIKDISFRQFALRVLPNAQTVEVLPKEIIQAYFFTTGKEGAKPIMSFHQEGGHTASWYTWSAPLPASQANLKVNWTPVKAIITFPHMWDHFDTPKDALDTEKAEAFKHKRHGLRFLFVLERSQEMERSRNLCLFPTLMRGEFHPVRKTVQAFSNNGRIETPQGEDIVGGLSIEQEGDRQVVVGMRTKNGQVSRYKITLFE